jgi:hypothetical protein
MRSSALVSTTKSAEFADDFGASIGQEDANVYELNVDSSDSVDYQALAGDASDMEQSEVMTMNVPPTRVTGVRVPNGKGGRAWHDMNEYAPHKDWSDGTGCGP